MHVPRMASDGNVVSRLSLLKAHLEVALVAGVQGRMHLLEEDRVWDRPQLRVCIEVDDRVLALPHLFHFLQDSRGFRV